MKIQIFFEESKPTEKMWAFTKIVADALELDLPEYTYEAVSTFLEENVDNFYYTKPIATYLGQWKYCFWMDPRKIIGDDM